MSVVRSIRSRCFAHLETARPYTVGYVGLVGPAGAALSGGEPTEGALVTAWAVPTLGWLAGLYGGDFFDRRLDAISKPQRPLPAGRMHPLEALGGMLLWTAAGAALAVAANWRSLGLVVFALGLGVSYSLLFKARGLLGNAVRGSVTALAFLFGTMTVTDLPRAHVLPIALLFWIHDAGTNLVGTLRDIEGDRAGGYRTLAVERGIPVAVRWASAACAFWLGLSLAIPSLIESETPSWAYWAVLAPTAFTALLALQQLWSADPLDARTALRAHEWLVLERIGLAGALLVYGAGAEFGTLVTGVLLLTAVTQQHMRQRYEFAAPEKTAWNDVRPFTTTT